MFCILQHIYKVSVDATFERQFFFAEKRFCRKTEIFATFIARIFFFCERGCSRYKKR